jgi:hypothetical protein
MSTANAGTVRFTEISERPENALIKVEIMIFPTSTRVDRPSSSSWS